MAIIPNIVEPNTWDRVISDPAVRRAATRESHLLFFYIYFAHYVKFESAPFHKTLFAITEDESIPMAVIEAFRNSAKTTIMGMSYPIWAILGRQQCKYVLLLAQTQQQARQYLANIKAELESNQLLRSDLGPFEEPADEWRAQSIVLPKYDARITVASIDQPIRGTRHGAHRPQLIICDDLEDQASVRSLDMRNKLYDWLTGEIMPLGSDNARTIIIGTRLHDNSLLMRIRKNIISKKMRGIARSFPLLDTNGCIAWPGRFPNDEAIEKEKMKIGDERAWQREYLLKIVGDVDQVVDPEWIHYYDELPLTKDNYEFTVTGIDPAFTEGTRSDFTAMVSAEVYRIDGQRYFYILPNPVNERLKTPDMLERIKMICANAYNGLGVACVEDVAGQKMIVHQLEGYVEKVISFNPGGSDKRTRIAMTSDRIKSAYILFPRHGAEQLIGQIVNYGVESHDDLMDAFTTMILGTNKYFIPFVGFV